MQALKHTGNSSNIAWYAEPRRDGPYIYAEVLRTDFNYRTRPITPLLRPRFDITVTRAGQGEVARRRYIPRDPVDPGPLPDEVVTRLVCEALKGSR